MSMPNAGWHSNIRWLVLLQWRRDHEKAWLSPSPDELAPFAIAHQYGWCHSDTRRMPKALHA